MAFHGARQMAKPATINYLKDHKKNKKKMLNGKYMVNCVPVYTTFQFVGSAAISMAHLPP